ncbi:MAG: hypothetical protein WA426_18170, partial [Silvibacterium sp.]
HPHVGPTSSIWPCLLKPGETGSNAGGLISAIYDFSRPGEYTIQVERHTAFDSKSPLVKSNTITITVLPADSSEPDSNNPQPSPQASTNANSVVIQSPTYTTRAIIAPSVPGTAARVSSNTLSVPESQKPASTFSISIEEDKTAALINPSLYRLLVTLTTTPQGVFVDQFHPEAKNMYNMTVLRDGLPVPETDAMRALENYRKVDRYPTVQRPFALKPGETLITTLDVSDYYDISRPGTYQVTVTRQSLPLNPAYSTLVTSNTINIVVPQPSAASNEQAVQEPKPRFDLNISQEDPEETPPTMIRVEMENTSDSAIREAKCWPFMGMYNFSVTRNGEQLRQNDEMRRLQKARAAVNCPGNETLNEIEPGDIYAEDVPLGNFYDITQPGVYQVYVTRETYPWNPAKSAVVESNSLSFEVPQPPADGNTAADAASQ